MLRAEPRKMMVFNLVVVMVAFMLMLCRTDVKSVEEEEASGKGLARGGKREGRQGKVKKIRTFLVS